MENRAYKAAIEKNPAALFKTRAGELTAEQIHECIKCYGGNILRDIGPQINTETIHQLAILAPIDSLYYLHTQMSAEQIEIGIENWPIYALSHLPGLIPITKLTMLVREHPDHIQRILQGNQQQGLALALLAIHGQLPRKTRSLMQQAIAQQI